MDKHNLDKKKTNKKEKIKNLFAEFKKFISKGNVVDMAIGVIMASSFAVIVTAFTNILLSICTWPLPGGLSGLITVLPAINDAQKGPVGQFFTSSELVEKTIEYAKLNGVNIDVNSQSYTSWQTSLQSLYALHGDTYYCKQSAILDWGTFLNAIITFIIIALILFIILKIISMIRNKSNELKDKFKKLEEEKWVKKHPEEAKKLLEEKLKENKKEEKDQNTILLEEILKTLKELKDKK